MIDNPAYFEDDTPFMNLLTIGAVGFELWTMNKGIFFDNIIITNQLIIANNYAREGYVEREGEEGERERERAAQVEI